MNVYNCPHHDTILGKDNTSSEDIAFILYKNMYYKRCTNYFDIYSDLRHLLRNVKDKKIKNQEFLDNIITKHLRSKGVTMPDRTLGNTIDSTPYVAVDYDVHTLINRFKHFSYI